jgi:ubiquinone/menaquinone biosynthesis C-methylase UbiE
MSHLYALKRKLQRRLPASYQFKLQEVIYFALYRLSPARHQNFFNSGYAPVHPELLGIEPFSREPLQATLYDFVLREIVSDIIADHDTILDIGCGLGGGLRLAEHHYPGSSLTGLDVSSTAVHICRSRLGDLPNASVLSGSGRELPFPDNSFDFIFSVGAAGYISLADFLREATRVLRPGGTLSFSVGFTNASFEQHQKKMTSYARRLNLNLQKIINITENVFAAIDEDTSRRMALIEQVPRILRGYALNWADMPGTTRYQEYVEGRRLDYAAVFTKK